MKILSFDIGIINLAYCVLDSDKKIHHWRVIELCNRSEIENTMDLIKKLDNHPEILDVDMVLLELQPRMNPKMRVMAEAVRSYLIFRGLVDGGRKFKMKNYSPKHKLSCWEGNLPDNLIPSRELLMDKTKSSLGKMYRLRKKQGIYQCGVLIQDQETSIRDIFYSAKKKDDLADCYLQGLSWLLFEDSKQVTARKPSGKQLKYKKYSKNNLKYLLGKHLDMLQSDQNLDDAILDWMRDTWIDRNLKNIYGINFSVDDVKSELLLDRYKDIRKESSIKINE
jgi:hypothetical protein